MKVGLLQCDDVVDELQAAFGNYPQMFEQALRKPIADLQMLVYDLRQLERPGDLDECDAYITTGSRHGVNDPLPWIANAEQLVRDIYRAKKPFVGVCFGHQLLAKALGARVDRAAVGWGVGVSCNEIKHKKPWMMPYQADLNLLVSHQDQVLTVPDSFEVVASSEFCPNYLVMCGSHMMGLQGHPEFSVEYSRALTLFRADRIGKTRTEEAIESLSLPVDGDLMFCWIAKFFADAMSCADNHYKT